MSTSHKVVNKIISRLPEVLEFIMHSPHKRLRPSEVISWAAGIVGWSFPVTTKFWTEEWRSIKQAPRSGVSPLGWAQIPRVVVSPRAEVIPGAEGTLAWSRKVVLRAPGVGSLVGTASRVLLAVVGLSPPGLGQHLQRVVVLRRAGGGVGWRRPGRPPPAVVPLLFRLPWILGRIKRHRLEAMRTSGGSGAEAGEE